MQLKPDGVVARISAALNTDRTAPSDTDLWTMATQPDPKLTAPQRRARLALRIALMRQHKPAPPPALLQTPVEPEPPAAEVPASAAPPSTPPASTPPPSAPLAKPRKAKMATVGLEDAALLLGSFFGQAEDDTAPAEIAGHDNPDTPDISDMTPDDNPPPADSQSPVAQKLAAKKPADKKQADKKPSSKTSG